MTTIDFDVDAIYELEYSCTIDAVGEAKACCGTTITNDEHLKGCCWARSDDEPLADVVDFDDQPRAYRDRIASLS